MASRVHPIGLSLAVIAVLALGGPTLLQSQQSERSIVASVAFSEKDLSALPTGGWFKNGGNLSNQNYSPLRQILRRTISTSARPTRRISSRAARTISRSHLTARGIWEARSVAPRFQAQGFSRRST